MAFNPKSLANLQRGANVGYKKRTTKHVAEQANTYLVDSYEYFSEQMLKLSPRDYVDAYMALMKLLLPKNINVDVSDVEVPNWTIQLASSIDNK